MKYIDAEKIRSEVERIKETGCESPISVCNDILSFIDYLQEEQPEVFDTVAFQKGVKEGKRLMMESAVEGFVGVHLHEERADVTVNSGYLPKEMGIKGDSKVKIIIVKEDEL